MEWVVLGHPAEKIMNLDVKAVLCPTLLSPSWHHCLPSPVFSLQSFSVPLRYKCWLEPRVECWAVLRLEGSGLSLQGKYILSQVLPGSHIGLSPWGEPAVPGPLQCASLSLFMVWPYKELGFGLVLPKGTGCTNCFPFLIMLNVYTVRRRTWFWKGRANSCL